MDNEQCKRGIVEIFTDTVLIQKALNQASRDASLMQKRVGYPVMIINCGKVAWISTDEIEI